jgi:hypothetical protein
MHVMHELFGAVTPSLPTLGIRPTLDWSPATVPLHILGVTIRPAAGRLVIFNWSRPAAGRIGTTLEISIRPARLFSRDFEPARIVLGLIPAISSPPF